MCASTIEGDDSTPVDLVIVIVALTSKRREMETSGVNANVSEYALRAGMAHECEGFGERTRQWGRIEGRAKSGRGVAMDRNAYTRTEGRE